MRLRLTLFLAVLVSLCVSAGAVPVREINVRDRGAGLADEESVLAFTSIREGDEFSHSALNRDIRNLQRTGRYSFVSTEVEKIPGGIVLTYVVESKPRISRLVVEGADYMGNRKVRELLELGVGDLVDEATLAVQSQKVVEAYNKKYFPNPQITWTIEPGEQPGTANVNITIDEGRRMKVRSIDFEGNRNVPDRVLRRNMEQRTANWLSWITGAGVYNPDQLETDVESLRRAYLDRGFLDARVLEPQVDSVRRNGVQIDIPVEEGIQYKVGRVDVSGVSVYPEDEIMQVLGLQSGDVAALERIEAAAQAVRDYYGSRGRIRTTVEYDLDIHPDDGTADVHFIVSEGRLAYVRNISVRGNTKTKDKVIRRELALTPGEVFNEVKVRTSERRLSNLNYFSYVNAVPETTPAPDQYDLVFDVEERETGQFMVGAGFSSVDDLIGFVELSQANFDLLDWPGFTGGGQKLKLRAQFGTKRTDYELSFVEPWFLNRRLSLGVNLFHHESRFLSDEYDQRNIGGSVSLGRALGTFTRLNLTYALEQINVYNVDDEASEAIRAEEGDRVKSSATVEIVRDTRDSFFIPTRGNRSSIALSLSGGPLAGETDIYSVEARSSQHWPLWLDHVFNIRGWAGVVDSYGDSERVPIFDRLFLGGARTLRGFRFRDVGPKDEQGEPVGGLSGAYATAEYTIPVAERVRLAAFYDVGMVWEDAYEFDFGNLNSSAGVGVRFDFPALPIQLDYSWPLQTDEFNDKKNGRFSFWLGYVY